jgi:hypothetical protein
VVVLQQRTLKYSDISEIAANVEDIVFIPAGIIFILLLSTSSNLQVISYFPIKNIDSIKI